MAQITTAARSTLGAARRSRLGQRRFSDIKEFVNPTFDGSCSFCRGCALTADEAVVVDLSPPGEVPRRRAGGGLTAAVADAMHAGPSGRVEVAP
jgi:hypothetical protein